MSQFDAFASSALSRSQLDIVEELACLCDNEYSDPTDWPSWTDDIVLDDGAPLCVAELLPGMAIPFTSEEDLNELRQFILQRRVS